MRAAVLTELGRAPEAADFDEPVAGGGEALVEVLAASLNPADRAMASGSFYAGSPPVPSVSGREGVGRVVAGDALGHGTRVYFDAPVAPSGSFAQRAVVREDSVFELPDGLDDALGASLGVAGLAAWLGLEWRGRLQRGETALVLGASGPVGQIAVQAARLLGAGRVVAAARSEQGLTRAAELGADATVRIGAVDDLAEALRAAAGGEGPDVILDPLWGEPAVAALRAAAPGARLVQLGQSAGAEAAVPSATVRGKALSIVGHSNFRTPAEVKWEAYRRLAEHAGAGELVLDLERVPLEQVADAWRRQGEHPHVKLVLIP